MPNQTVENYQNLLSSLCAKQWNRIGIDRRAGIATPLFSLFSAKSMGIGEIPDLKLLVDWCKTAGMSVVQLLPMNDVGFSFTPYDSQSTFALEPMYLSLNELTGVRTKIFEKDLQALKSKFPAGQARVDYGIKGAKLELLWKMFESQNKDRSKAFEKFVSENRYWLENYALFKVIKQIKQEAGWENWDEALRKREPSVLKGIEKEYAQSLEFQRWLQWQLFEQFRDIKKYASANGVYMMGDLPFLVSRDSADVWAHQDYFKLYLASGAPPDMYFASGQRWGMPPYDWPKIEARDYDYLKEKLKYAQNFYDMFRIDHVVGIFRVWTIQLSEPAETGGLNGVFDPPEEEKWEDHGRKIISVMIQNTSMLPCAEDLGVVPPCSYKVLEEFGIPGLDVQRWGKDWGKSYGFKHPQEYRKTSVGVLSSHDMTSLRGWWEYEVGTVDGMLFERLCREKGISYEAVKEKLFDLSRSHHGRMLWKEEIRDVRALLSVLGRSESEAWHLADLYKGSFGEKQKFLDFLGLGSEDPSRYQKCSNQLIRLMLEKINHSASVLSVQLLQDWLSLDTDFQYDPWNFRINFPGTFGDQNWTLVVPYSLEKMLGLPINAQIKEMVNRANRV